MSFNVINILAFFLLFNTNMVFACKSELTNFDRRAMLKMLEDNPSEAKFAYIGRVTEPSSRSNVQDFVVEKAWGLINKKIVHVATGICDKQYYELGKYYLLLTNSPEEKDLILLVELDKAKKMIDKLALKKNFIGDVNPSWKYCTKDVECKLVKDNCSRSMSVNEKYEKNI